MDESRLLRSQKGRACELELAQDVPLRLQAMGPGSSFIRTTPA
jgi:hypothetical protein